MNGEPGDGDYYEREWPPSPLSRGERERVVRTPDQPALRAPSHRPLDGLRPDRQSIQAMRDPAQRPRSAPPANGRRVRVLLAVIVLLAIGAVLALAALNGDDATESDVAGPNVDTSASSVGDGAPQAEGQDSTVAADNGQTAADEPASTATTVPTTATGGPLGTPVQAALDGDVVRLSGVVSSEEEAATIVALLEAVIGVGSVQSELTIDGGAMPATGISLLVGDEVTFPTGSATIETDFLPILDRMSALMIDDPSISIVVKGHSDASGDPVRNLALSQERAEAVVSYIAEQGINRFRLEARGRGSTEPVADESTAEGQARNRRIEFIIFGL